MIDLLKVACVFVVILLLLRKKMKVGYVLLIASLVLYLFYMPGAMGVKSIIKRTLLSHITLVLLIALTAIRMFEMILRERQVLDGMMKTMERLLRHKRLVVVSMPLLIGMMPSVGGAYFSAPMVDKATSDMELTPEEKTFANYWYRHPWEFVLPLYPGVVLASAITSIALRVLILHNLPYAVVMFLVGFYFIKRIKGKNMTVSRGQRGWAYFLPLMILLFLVIGLNLPIEYALLIVVTGLLAFYRYSLKKIISVIKYGLSPDIILLILGVVCFKETLEITGAVQNIGDFFKQNNIPLLPVVFFLPFITGILTGITVGFVSSTFPLILSLTGPEPYLFSLAFAAGYAGVLLSPVHVCLILTREYFCADVLPSYRKILPATLIVVAVALIKYSLWKLM